MLEVEKQAPGTTGAGAPPVPPDAETMRVRWQADDRFDIQVRGHTITDDPPVEIDGGDVGPTPTELFVAGLASCIAFYARRYLRRHRIDPPGLEVITSYRMGAKPARVACVDLEISVPAELSTQRREGLLAQAGH